MSKFCGNCGFKLDDDAKVCGACGTPLDNGGANKGPETPEFKYVDPEKRAKNKKKIKTAVVASALIIVLIIAANIISGFVGYKGTARKIMNAYTDYDIDAIISMSSDLYYNIGSEDASQRYAETYFGTNMKRVFDTFEKVVGHEYKLSYKITDSYEMSKPKYKELQKTLSKHDNFDPEIISKAMIVETKVKVKSDDNETKIDVVLTLTKENGSWKLLYLK